MLKNVRNDRFFARKGANYAFMSEMQNESREVAEPLDHPKTHALVNRIMRRQASLSLQVAAVFVFVLIAIPLVNAYYPDIYKVGILGFPMPWLILGVLFFPLTWLLSAYFVRASDELDVQIARDEEKV